MIAIEPVWENIGDESQTIEELKARYVESLGSARERLRVCAARSRSWSSSASTGASLSSGRPRPATAQVTCSLLSRILRELGASSQDWGGTNWTESVPRFPAGYANQAPELRLSSLTAGLVRKHVH
jgi:hypothetical protein